MNPYLMQALNYGQGILKTPAAQHLTRATLNLPLLHQAATFMDDDRLSDTEKMQADQFGAGDINFSDTESYIGPEMIPGNQPLGFVDGSRDFSQFNQARMGFNQPMGTDTIAEAMIDEDRIPGRNQKEVPNYQNWFERMMSGAQNKLGGAWGKTKELGSRFKEGAKPVFGLASMIGNATNPLNPDSYNYNPELAGELNYLNTQPNMLVDNATSGLLQYGPDSVLSGKNVMSLLGSNSYNEALNNKVGWFEDRLAKGKTISRANYNKAKAEKKAHQNRIQERLNKENAAAAVNAARQVKMEQARKGGQNPSAGTFSGHSPGGISQQTSRDARGGMSGWGLARGGRVRFANGGLATLFTRRG